MTWNEAKEGTIRQWTSIRDAIGTADTVALLTEINAVCDLCEKSDEVKGGTPFGRCDYCLFYQQFGGCQKVSATMSELVASRRWKEVRALVDGHDRQDAGDGHGLRNGRAPSGGYDPPRCGSPATA